jgi:hypothetical protein
MLHFCCGYKITAEQIRQHEARTIPQWTHHTAWNHYYQ